MIIGRKFILLEYLSFDLPTNLLLFTSPHSPLFFLQLSQLLAIPPGQLQLQYFFSISSTTVLLLLLLLLTSYSLSFLLSLSSFLIFFTLQLQSIPTTYYLFSFIPTFMVERNSESLKCLPCLGTFVRLFYYCTANLLRNN